MVLLQDRTDGVQRVERAHSRHRNLHAKRHMERYSALLRCEGQCGKFRAVRYSDRKGESVSCYYHAAGKQNNQPRRFRHSIAEGFGERLEISVVLLQDRTDGVQRVERAHSRHRNLHAKRHMERYSALLRCEGQCGKFRAVRYSDRKGESVSCYYHAAGKQNNQPRRFRHSIAEGFGERLEISVVLLQDRTNGVQHVERAHSRFRNLHSERHMERDSALLRCKRCRRKFREVQYSDRKG